MGERPEPSATNYVSLPRRRNTPGAGASNPQSAPEPSGSAAQWAGWWQTMFRVPAAPEAPHTPTPGAQFASPVWMPDAKCNHCYDCTAHFSAIRRKHHCRMCGNIFCHQCAPHFVPSSFLRLAAQAVNERKSRVCEFCHRRLRAEFPNLTTTPDLDRLDAPSSPDDQGKTSGAASQPSPETQKGEGTQFSPGQSPRSLASPTYTSHNVPVVTDNDVLESHEHEWAHMKQVSCHHFVRSVFHAGKVLSERHPEFMKRRGGLGKDVLMKICELARQAVSILSPPCFDDEKIRILPNNVSAGRNDILTLLKIKELRPASPASPFFESRYVKGVVFEHHVTHNKMKTQLTDCRVLLLSGSLEFQEERRLVSLDVLRTQEIPYFQLIVEKIADLRPVVEVLLCGSFVAHSAQELLLVQGITLIQNVPLPILQAVSRVTGAPILPSLDFVDVPLSYRHMAAVTNHHPQTHPGAYSTDINSMSGEDGNGIAKRFSVQHLGNTTLVVIEGSVPQYGGTICISSPDKEMLAVVKTVLRWAIRMAYLLQLHTEFIFEHWCDSPRDLLLLDEPMDVRAWCLTSPIGYFDMQPRDYQALFKKAHRGDAANVIKPPALSTDDAKTVDDDAEHTPSFDDEVGPFTWQIQRLEVLSYLIGKDEEFTTTESRPVVFDCLYGSDNDLTLREWLHQEVFDRPHGVDAPKVPDKELKETQPKDGEHYHPTVQQILCYQHLHGRVLVTLHVDKSVPTLHKTRWSCLGLPHEPPQTHIRTWHWCKICKAQVALCTFLSGSAARIPFGKFLELFFYNTVSTLSRLATVDNATGTTMTTTTAMASCDHCVFRHHQLFFQSTHAKDALSRPNRVPVSVCFEWAPVVTYSLVHPQKPLWLSSGPHKSCSAGLLGYLGQCVDHKEMWAIVWGRRQQWHQVVQGLAKGLPGTWKQLHQLQNHLLAATAQAESAQASPTSDKKNARASAEGRRKRRSWSVPRVPGYMSSFVHGADSVPALEKPATFRVTPVSGAAKHSRSLSPSYSRISERTHKRKRSADVRRFGNFLQNVTRQTGNDLRRSTTQSDFPKVESRRRCPSVPTRWRTVGPKTNTSLLDFFLRDKMRAAPSAADSASQQLAPLSEQQHVASFASAACSSFAGSEHTSGSQLAGCPELHFDDEDWGSVIAQTLTSKQTFEKMQVHWCHYSKTGLCPLTDRRGCAHCLGGVGFFGDDDGVQGEGLSGVPSTSAAGESGQKTLLSGQKTLEFPPGIQEDQLRYSTHEEQYHPTIMHGPVGELKVRCQRAMHEILTMPRGGSAPPDFKVEWTSATGTTFAVTVHYCVHFHVLRHWLTCGDFAFASSLQRTESHVPSGGKSGLQFYITEDKQFLLKEMSRAECKWFYEKGEVLFWYNYQALYNQLPSMLTQIYGVYHVVATSPKKRKSGQKKEEFVFMVMRNVRYHIERGLPAPSIGSDIAKWTPATNANICIFDLKGVGKNRRARTDVIPPPEEGTIAEDLPSSDAEVEVNKSFMSTSRMHLQKALTLPLSTSPRLAPRDKTTATPPDKDKKHDVDRLDPASLRTSTCGGMAGSSTVPSVYTTTGGSSGTRSNTVQTRTITLSSARTLWDQNFREWTCGMPLVLSKSDMDYFEKALWNDTYILSKWWLMDYSLLMIVSPGISPRDQNYDHRAAELTGGPLISVGLIDYIRLFTWDKHIESVGKTIASLPGGMPPTVIPPDNYAQRFRGFFGTLFVKEIPCLDKE
eukprot:GEMP01001260.1.p1 GENE.GEMP01001260.1~~GEMP01001260.1.p1  ORF type:complete len:1730 (+),score=451.55 GEMP01001260.1:92-5281(+)